MNKKEAKEKLSKNENARNLLLQEVSVIDDEQKKLQAIIDAPDSGWFVPEINERYFFLTPNSIGYTRNNTNSDEKVIEHQKVFRTEAEARREDEKRIAVTKYLKEIARLNNGEKVDWDNSDQRKYLAEYSHKRNSTEIEFYYQIQQKDSEWYSLSLYAAKQALSILSETEIDLIFRS